MAEFSFAQSQLRPAFGAVARIFLLKNPQGRKEFGARLSEWKQGGVARFPVLLLVGTSQ